MKYIICKATVVLMVFLFISAVFIYGSSMAEDEKNTITVTVEVFSGRPNPSFEISDTEEVARLRQNLEYLPSLAMNVEERAEFSRLGYRGILITSSGNIVGIPGYIQCLSGKVKVSSAMSGGENRFFSDVAHLEKYYLGLAKKRGLIPQDLLDNKIVPDPDTM